MSTLAHIKTLLFDVDGTLLDSNGAHARSWTEALRDLGITVDDAQMRRLIGMGGDKLLPAAAGVSEDSPLGRAAATRKKEIFATLLSSVAPTRGARPLVEYVRGRGVALAIATSADDKEVTALLRQAGVDDLFDRRASKDDAPQSKPDPDIVHAAMARARADAATTLLVGDTPYDIEAADRAGIAAVALRCGGYWSDADLRRAILIVDDPQALLARWRSE